MVTSRLPILDSLRRFLILHGHCAGHRTTWLQKLYQVKATTSLSIGKREIPSFENFKAKVSHRWSLGILIFEMLCGYTPFWDGGSPMKIYENILKGKVKYPPYIHPDAQDLLQRLITSDLTKRLGNLHGGSDDVKNHPWFAEVTWERLGKKDIDAPYVPPVKAGVGDTSQFDKYPEETEAYGQTGRDELVFSMST